MRSSRPATPSSQSSCARSFQRRALLVRPVRRSLRQANRQGACRRAGPPPRRRPGFAAQRRDIPRHGFIHVLDHRWRPRIVACSSDRTAQCFSAHGEETVKGPSSWAGEVGLLKLYCGRRTFSCNSNCPGVNGANRAEARESPRREHNGADGRRGYERISSLNHSTVSSLGEDGHAAQDGAGRDDHQSDVARIQRQPAHVALL